MPATGSERTRLVILRGNSGSGKSTTARELRTRLGRGTAWIEQDHLRRIVLWEPDVAGGVNIGLIEQTARYALDHGYDAIVEGILFAGRYGDMLRRLIDDHAGLTRCYFFDLTLEETLRRHATKPLAREVTADQVRGWYAGRDLLPFVDERIVTAADTLEHTVDRILADLADLADPAAPDGSAGATDPADRPGCRPGR